MPSLRFLTLTTLESFRKVLLPFLMIQSGVCNVISPGNPLVCYVGSEARFNWTTDDGRIIFSANWGLKNGNSPDSQFINTNVYTNVVNYNTNMDPKYRDRDFFVGNLTMGRAWFLLKNVTMYDAKKYVAHIRESKGGVLAYIVQLKVKKRAYISWTTQMASTPVAQTSTSFRITVSTTKRSNDSFTDTTVVPKREIHSALIDMAKKGKTNQIMVHYIEQKFGIQWSTRTLKRRLRALGISRHSAVGHNDIVQAIQKEIEGPGKHFGYRHMHQRLRMRHDLPVRRNEVYEAMRLVNLDGVQARKKQVCTRRDYVSVGSNWIWHIDGHDKLKRYGFAIHAAIDGFSRKILWCHVDGTNNDPRYIAKYYIDFVKQNRVVPCMTRCDAGTENGLLATSQMYLRRNDTDNLCGINSHVYGSSMRNQRIEAYWHNQRQHNSLFWEIQFQEMESEGLLVIDDPIHKACLQYVYMLLLRRELADFVEEHNSHRIRKQRGRLTPQGIPEDLYNFPEIKGFRNAGFKPSEADLLEITQELDLELPDYVSREFRQKANMFFDIEITLLNAKDAFLALVSYIKNTTFKKKLSK